MYPENMGQFLIFYPTLSDGLLKENYCACSSFLQQRKVSMLHGNYAMLFLTLLEQLDENETPSLSLCLFILGEGQFPISLDIPSCKLMGLNKMVH